MADISQLGDLLADTLRDLPYDQFAIAMDQPRYPFCHILRDENISSRGGVSIQKNIALTTQFGQAATRTMYQTDQPIVVQSMNQINVPWTFLAANYSYDINELMMNVDDEVGFVDVILQKREIALAQLALLYETIGWGVPISAGDTVNPYGMQYYFPFLNNGATTAGFNATNIRYSNGTTGTICAGIDASVFSRWGAYAAPYTNVDNTLLRTVRSAIRQTDFEFPPFMQDDSTLANSRVDEKVGLYVNDVTMSQMQDLLAKMGDGGVKEGLFAGVDATVSDSGKSYVTIDGIPLCYNPFLDSETVVNTAGNTVNPNSILCVRWNAIRPTTLKDFWNKETLPMADRGQHTTLTVFIDSTWNNVVIDRRRAGFRLHNPL